MVFPNITHLIKKSGIVILRCANSWTTKTLWKFLVLEFILIEFRNESKLNLFVLLVFVLLLSY